MKKIITSTLIICGTFQLNHAMDNVVFASFRDAVLGKKRNIVEEIKATEADTALTHALRNKKLGGLYSELRNQHRGTELYDEYNRRMSEYYETAQSLEKKEKQIEEVKSQQKVRETKEAEILEKIDGIKLTATPQRNLLGYEEIIKQYHKLKELFKEIDTEKYNLYDAHLNSCESKRKYQSLQVTFEQVADKSEKVKCLRQMSELSTKKKKAEKLTAQAEALEKELKYEELNEMARATNDLSQKAKLHRVMMYWAEEHAEENLALAKQFEEQAEKEREQYLAVVEKTCRIVGFKMEIAIADANKDKKLTPYTRLKTLAQLMEQCGELAQSVPKFKDEFSDSPERVQRLRREAIGCASNDTERKEMIALLKY